MCVTKAHGLVVSGFCRGAFYFGDTHNRAEDLLSPDAHVLCDVYEDCRRVELPLRQPTACRDVYVRLYIYGCIKAVLKLFFSLFFSSPATCRDVYERLYAGLC